MSNLLLSISGQVDPQEYLPVGWAKVTLDKICTVFGGGRIGLTKEKNYQSSGVKAYSAAGPDGYVNIAEIKNREGVILSAIGAKCGKCFYASGDWTTLANVQVLLPNDNIDAKYLYYYLNRDNYWEKSGSAQPFIKPSSIKKSWVVFPNEKSEQAKIAEVLSAVDSSIQQTEALIDKYQRAKAGLMQDLLNKGIDESGNIRSKKTHKFKDSPIGIIPVEWEISTIYSVLANAPKNGYSPIESNDWNGMYMLGLGCLTPEGFKPRQLKYAPEIDAKIESSILKNGDFLISRANTRALVGMVGIYKDIGEPCIYPDLMVRLRFGVGVSTEFMEQIFMSSEIRRQIENAASGTSSSMVKISSSIIKELIFKKPPLEEQLTILEILQSKSSEIQTMRMTLSKLLLLKTALMQDLLTGKKSVTLLRNQTEVSN